MERGVTERVVYAAWTTAACCVWPGGLGYDLRFKNAAPRSARRRLDKLLTRYSRVNNFLFGVSGVAARARAPGPVPVDNPMNTGRVPVLLSWLAGGVRPACFRASLFTPKSRMKTYCAGCCRVIFKFMYSVARFIASSCLLVRPFSVKARRSVLRLIRRPRSLAIHFMQEEKLLSAESQLKISIVDRCFDTIV